MKPTITDKFHIISRYVKLCTVKSYELKKMGTKPANLLHLTTLPLPHTFIFYREMTVSEAFTETST